MVQTLEHPAPTVAKPRRLVNFGWHFVEMCAAMCLAWMLVALPLIAVARTAGTADPVRRWPEVATILAAGAMSAGMAAEMRWRGHGWRCIAEMTAAMVVEAAAVFVLAVAGVIPRVDEFAWYHGLMPLAMVAAMLVRVELYTAPLNHRRRTTAVV